MEIQDLANSAIFFISTGRCATQFFADKLATHYKDLAVVKHEPFKYGGYKPRYYFSAYHRNDDVDLTPALQQHVGSINKILTDFHYIETGWPVYGALPYMLSRFKGRVKVVHLYRHPLKVAASLTTHSVYSLGEWSNSMSISPSDYGVVQSYLAGNKWNLMSEFEKCLFWWTEINHFALELREKFTSTPWLSLKFEDVFSDKGDSELKKLSDFLSLPVRKGFLDSLGEKTDGYSYKTDKILDINRLANYPAAIQVMEQLGYSFNPIIMKEVRERYNKSLGHMWLGSAKRRARHAFPRLYERLGDLKRHWRSRNGAPQQ